MSLEIPLSLVIGGGLGRMELMLISLLESNVVWHGFRHTISRLLYLMEVLVRGITLDGEDVEDGQNQAVCWVVTAIRIVCSCQFDFVCIPVDCYSQNCHL